MMTAKRLYNIHAAFRFKTVKFIMCFLQKNSTTKVWENKYLLETCQLFQLMSVELLHLYCILWSQEFLRKLMSSVISNFVYLTKWFILKHQQPSKFGVSISYTIDWEIRYKNCQNSLLQKLVNCRHQPKITING